MSELVVRTLKLLAETKDGFLSAVKNIFNTRTMATLKISDLSVGDWIKVILNKCDYDGPETLDAKVLSIEGNSVGVGYDNSGIVMSAFVDRLTPIHITPEILKENGFVKWQGGLVLIGDEVSCRYEDGNLTIEHGYRDNEEVLVERLLVNIECLYVHQLQHALRLAGVDKEINL